MELIDYKPRSLFVGFPLYFSIYQQNSKKQAYTLCLDRDCETPEGFIECASSFRELHNKVRGILREHPEILFEIRTISISKRDKKRKDKIRSLIARHNSSRSLEKEL